MKVTTVAALDLGGGYVRIDAAGVSDEEALDIASDIVLWLREMNAKHRQADDEFDGDWSE